MPIADDDKVKPGGQVIVPRQNPDPLDPTGLNTPLTPAEEKAIADTLNMISSGRVADLLTLDPRPYQNRPQRVTGAQLSIGDVYTTYYVGPKGGFAGRQRIVTGASGSAYYSRLHYESFYRISKEK